MAFIVTLLIALDLSLIYVLFARRELLSAAGGKVLAFVALFLLPSIVASQGLVHHLNASKSTSFCLSCHVMEPYGRSLRIDSADHVPANHFQNRRIDRDTACYTCHTSYAMFGDVQAKMAGVQHLLVNYFGSTPETLALYRPYSNRECLHCHSGARRYEEHEFHMEMARELRQDETSCLECHDLSHDIGNLDQHELWEAP